MPVITLSDATYAMLKAYAEPFVDTEESVIRRALDALQREAISLKRNADTSTQTNGSLRLEPGSHELVHTRVTSATVDARPIHHPKWNSLMNHLHVLGRKRFGSFDALRKASSANLRDGKYEENGYKYLPEADISIQGVAADRACEHSFQLAKAMGVPIKVTVEWRNKEGAAHPGRTGVVEWTPSQS
jgi:hypothetical protein